MKKVIYRIYDPKGKQVGAAATRKLAKNFIDKMNKDIPSWHYDALYKMGAVVIETEGKNE